MSGNYQQLSAELVHAEGCVFPTKLCSVPENQAATKLSLLITLAGNVGAGLRK